MKPAIRFSQNFLHSPALVENLLSKTDVNSQDVVYDIGAGKGIITDALAKKARTVIAIEIDKKLTDNLHKKFQNNASVIVHDADFLHLSLPRTPYKVFANIPYNLSADILHKLTDTDYPPKSSYLIVQREFAEKLVTKPDGYNSQQSIILGTKFNIRIVENIAPRNFYPRPRVGSVLVEITKRSQPLIMIEDTNLFRNFVVFSYNAFKPTVAEALKWLFDTSEFCTIAGRLHFQPNATPSQLDLHQWVKLFTFALQKRGKLEDKVKDYEVVLANKHANRTKNHRTRKSY